MWTDEKRERYEFLRERQQTGGLTDEERRELAALVRDAREHEEACLTAANERKAAEVGELTTAVERLEDQNARLRQYLRERQAFLARARSVVAQLHAEDRRIRERY